MGHAVMEILETEIINAKDPGLAGILIAATLASTILGAVVVATAL